MSETISILTGSLDDVVAISHEVPELENPYTIEEYSKRLFGVPHLVLIARVQGRNAGFKVGYEREKDGSFYSWMGGVLPEFRRNHIAKLLADAQEDWARGKGYSLIRFKTRNRHKAMLAFALRNGFNITGIDSEPLIEENRIWLEKKL